MYDTFTCKQLDDTHVFYQGRLPTELVPDQEAFELLWNLHPDEYHEIVIHGRLVKTPRWQQAFGKDYEYSKQTNEALPVPGSLQPFLDWARHAIDGRLDGILLNWYDGKLGHYIGRHRDSTKKMVRGAPIVTISLGEERKFRLRPWKRTGFIDFVADHGTVFIMPYQTNLVWTHEVPHSAKCRGRRISVTLRAFR